MRGSFNFGTVPEFMIDVFKILKLPLVALDVKNKQTYFALYVNYILKL